MPSFFAFLSSAFKRFNGFTVCQRPFGFVASSLGLPVFLSLVMVVCTLSACALTATPTPYFSPAGGVYKSVQNVIITDANAGAIIYYTLDGSTPTVGSSVYTGPLNVAVNQTVRAIGVVSGLANSSVATATYSILLPAATPVYSPAAGTYTSIQSVSISDATPGASIFYTLDGSTPTAASTLYTGPLSVAVNRTLQSIALASGGSASSAAKAIYTIQLPAATPVIAPASGTFKSAQMVTISDATPGATIYYTVNGAMPNTSSPQYSAPFQVANNSVVKAMALATGGSLSPLATENLLITAATPIISPASGTYNAAQSVVITDATPGVYIYYTTDGKTPTTASKRYTGPITVNANQTVQAMAYSVSYVSSVVAAASYTIKLPAALPSISPAGGTFTTARSVTLKCSTANSVIYYTNDGSLPTVNSAVYSAPISVSSNQTIMAMAMAPQGVQGPTASAVFTITPPAAKPVIVPAGGKFTTVQSVVLSDTTPNATIYYTTDGSVPSAQSAVYTLPLTVDASAAIQAVALAPGGVLSPAAKATFTIQLPTAPPVLSPQPGTYSSIQQVVITDATPGAVIYYSLNGKYPTTASTVYSGPITATSSSNIQAIAIAPNRSTSAATAGVYTIVTPAPSISPASGSFNYSTPVALSDAASNAIIYYTLDGSTPTSASAVYSKPILLSPSRTTTSVIRAFAVAPNQLASATSSASVTVTLPGGVLAHAEVGMTPQMAIPADFMGLSSDWTQPASLMGTVSKGVNRPYYQLLKNLATYSSAPLLYRIEGDNTTLANLQTATQPLVELAREVNVSYVLGVDLAHGSLATAESQTMLWAASIPADRIRAYEIGNEPDLYGPYGLRPYSYNFSSYLAEYNQWVQGMASVVGNTLQTMGPADANSPWMAAAISALGAGTYSPAIVSQHAYLSGPAKGTTLPADYLLQPIAVTKLPTGYAPYAAAAHKAGRLFRMSEINSVGGGGVAGISDSFSASLWSIDIMFQYLANGMDGVNWHSGEYTQYAIAKFLKQPNLSVTQYTLTQVNPLYYGLWTFAQVAGNSAQLLPTHTMTDANVSIWTTRDAASVVHAVVINKETSATGDIVLSVPGYTSAMVRYLKAPSYMSNTGVSLGGLTFDGSVDGLPVGTPSSFTLELRNDVFTIQSLPPTTAAVIDFTQ